MFVEFQITNISDINIFYSLMLNYFIVSFPAFMMVDFLFSHFFGKSK